MIIFLTILFVLSFLVIASLFLVKVSQVSQRSSLKVRINPASTINHETLWPYFRQKLGIAGNKLWHFILEAKDLTPATTKTIQSQVSKMKNVFRIRAIFYGYECSFRHGALIEKRGSNRSVHAVKSKQARTSKDLEG